MLSAVAKNVALSGVRRLTLHDTKAATQLDRATHFYLTDNDIGRNRAELSLAQLDELNPYVSVDVSTHSLDADLSVLDAYQVYQSIIGCR